jgi:hypothetical protein
MRSLYAISVLLLSTACFAQEGRSAHPATDTGAGGQPFDDHATTGDARLQQETPRFREGRYTVHTDAQGGKIQAEVDANGVITDYLMVDADGSVSGLEEQPSLSVALRSGKPALVHECFTITKECLENPLPRSGNPEDCKLVIPCPKKGSFSTELLR